MRAWSALDVRVLLLRISAITRLYRFLYRPLLELELSCVPNCERILYIATRILFTGLLVLVIVVAIIKELIVTRKVTNESST